MGPNTIWCKMVRQNQDMCMLIQPSSLLVLLYLSPELAGGGIDIDLDPTTEMKDEGGLTNF